MGASGERKDEPQMKAAIFNPYWDTLGGGERYTMGVVQALLEQGYKVDIEWKEQNLLKKIEGRFGIQTEGVNILDSVNRGDGYDICFWISDGSIPLLRSRNNILHFQVPFTKVNGKTVMNKMKFLRIKHVVCNSQFTKNIIDKEYGINSEVLYPPVGVEKIKSKRKENVILYVGRFSKLLQTKRQDILVNNFKAMVDTGLKDWKLILAGGTEVGGEEATQYFKKEAEGYPIQIVESPSFKQLVELYGKAKIFWSAGGYGIDQVEDPQKVEHFGISLVEAMAGGAVPIAYEAGGHTEIIENSESGYLWKKGSQLQEITRMLMENKKELTKVAKNAKQRSKMFSYAEFKKRFYEYLN
jgi:glycosyltransferase involved in cell wall biosynthesis